MLLFTVFSSATLDARLNGFTGAVPTGLCVDGDNNGITNETIRDMTVLVDCEEVDCPCCEGC